MNMRLIPLLVLIVLFPLLSEASFPQYQCEIHHVSSQSLIQGDRYFHKPSLRGQFVVNPNHSETLEMAIFAENVFTLRLEYHLGSPFELILSTSFILPGNVSFDPVRVDLSTPPDFFRVPLMIDHLHFQNFREEFRLFCLRTEETAHLGIGSAILKNTILKYEGVPLPGGIKISQRQLGLRAKVATPWISGYVNGKKSSKYRDHQPRIRLLFETLSQMLTEAGEESFLKSEIDAILAREPGPTNKIEKRKLEQVNRVNDPFAAHSEPVYFPPVKRQKIEVAPLAVNPPVSNRVNFESIPELPETSPLPTPSEITPEWEDFHFDPFGLGSHY